MTALARSLSEKLHLAFHSLLHLHKLLHVLLPLKLLFEPKPKQRYMAFMNLLVYQKEMTTPWFPYNFNTKQTAHKIPYCQNQNSSPSSTKISNLGVCLQLPVWLARYSYFQFITTFFPLLFPKKMIPT